MTVPKTPTIPKYPPTILRSTRFHQHLAFASGRPVRISLWRCAASRCRCDWSWIFLGEIQGRSTEESLDFSSAQEFSIVGCWINEWSRWRSSVENCLGYLGLMFPKSLTKCAKNNSSKLEGKRFWCHLSISFRPGTSGGIHRNTRWFPKNSPPNDPSHISWLVVWNMNLIFHDIYIYMGCHPSHWRTHVFQDGYCTTNQISIEYWSLWWLAEPWRTRSIDRLGDCSASGAMRWCEGVDDKHELYMGS